MMHRLMTAGILATLLCACATQQRAPVVPEVPKPPAETAGYLVSHQSAFKLALYSNEELMDVEGTPDKEVPLKPGTYVVAFLEFSATDGTANWKLERQGKAGEIKIEPGQRLELPFGPPLKATLEATKAPGAVSFRPVLRGRGGEEYPVYALRNPEQQALPPKLEIRKPDGTLLQSGEFKYG